MADKFALLSKEDFKRLAQGAVPVTSPFDIGMEIVPDRFGVVSEGMMLMIQVPSSEVSLSSDMFLRDYAELAEDRIMAMRYAFELKMPKRPTFIGIDFVADRRSAREMWAKQWQRSSRRKRDKMQRRLDWSSNVRRVKRWRELTARKAKP
jgi:hypothetical protein